MAVAIPSSLCWELPFAHAACPHRRAESSLSCPDTSFKNQRKRRVTHICESMGCLVNESTAPLRKQHPWQSSTILISHAVSDRITELWSPVRLQGQTTHWQWLYDCTARKTDNQRKFINHENSLKLESK